MAATDVRFTEILVVKLAVRASVALVQPWLRIQVREQQQRQREGEAFIIDERMLGVMLTALAFGACEAIVIARWIATGRGPGVRVLVLSS